METIKSLLWKPTPEEQVGLARKRKCNALVRQNVRKLDRDIMQLKQAEQKTKSYIVQASKRAQRNPAMAKQAAQDTRVFAKELIRVRKQSSRLHTSKAQLQSVQMQVNEAFSVRKIEGSIRASTGIMKDVNTLVRLPELTGTMRELSQELVKAGIIEEMVGDSLPDSELLEGEDDEAESEVDKVLSEVLKDKISQAQEPKQDLELPSQPVHAEEEEDPEEMLSEMRGRLEALKS
ncbi:Vacuolar protein-sorting-associated protein 24 [Botryosphaeria dothidea]